jgi:hypothetical protein
MNGRKVVKTGSLNVTDVIGLAVFLGFFLALLGPGSRVICVIRGVSPLPWPAIASAKEAALQRFNVAKHRSA